MDERVSVVEDGLSPAPRTEGSRSPWVVAAVAFAVGLGLGVFATAPESEVPPASLPESEGDFVLGGSDDGGEEPVPIEEQGISEVVEGFPDALVAVARTTGSTVDYLLWPIAGELSERPMAGGTDVVLDATAQFVALSTELPDGTGSVLSMGRYNSIRPVAPGVSSYAFHDATNGWLAYTVPEGPVTHLLTVKANFEPAEVVVIDERAATIVGWGDWGFALQRPTGELVLLNPEGEFKDTEIGLGYATHSSGWVLAEDGLELKLVSAGGGVRRLGAAEGVGAIQTASFSPDGSKVALDGERAAAVFDLQSGEITRFTEFSIGPMAWSSDSRFVVGASSSGVLVFDISENEIHPLLRQYAVLAAGVVPLTSS